MPQRARLSFKPVHAVSLDPIEQIEVEEKKKEQNEKPRFQFDPASDFFIDLTEAEVSAMFAQASQQLSQQAQQIVDPAARVQALASVQAEISKAETQVKVACTQFKQRMISLNQSYKQQLKAAWAEIVDARDVDAKDQAVAVYQRLQEEYSKEVSAVRAEFAKTIHAAVQGFTQGTARCRQEIQNTREQAARQAHIAGHL